MALLVCGVVLFVVVVSGFRDPQPVGVLVDETPFGPLTVAPGEEALLWLGAPESRVPRSYLLTANLAAGEADSGYGLAVGDDRRAFIAAVSPLGYVSVWERDEAGDTTAVWLPWQTWPHVRPGGAPNEVWLDVVPDGAVDRLTVRVNRELLWQGSVAPPAGGVGRWATTFGDDATFDGQRLRRFASPPTANAGE